MRDGPHLTIVLRDHRGVSSAGADPDLHCVPRRWSSAHLELLIGRRQRVLLCARRSRAADRSGRFETC